MEKGRQAGEGERERERGTKGTGQGRDGAGESDQRTRERELDETGEMGRDGDREDPRKGAGESQPEGWERAGEGRTG